MAGAGVGARAGAGRWVRCQHLPASPSNGYRPDKQFASTLPVGKQKARLSLHFYWHISPLIWEKIWQPIHAGLPRAALDNLFK